MIHTRAFELANSNRTSIFMCVPKGNNLSNEQRVFLNRTMNSLAQQNNKVEQNENRNECSDALHNDRFESLPKEMF